MSEAVTERGLNEKVTLLQLASGVTPQFLSARTQNAANIAAPILVTFWSSSFDQAGIAKTMVPARIPPPAPSKPKQGALDSLYDIYSQCCRPGWDGYGALAASYDSYLRAKQFIESLPADLPAPQIAIDPDGEASLEWYCEPGRVFSASISANGELTYAGKFSHNEKTHGTVPFSDQVPEVILVNIRHLLA